MNSNRYVRIMPEFFLSTLNEMDVGDVRFQQDSASAHTAQVSMTVLRHHFYRRLISLRSDQQWPVWCPGLAPCDFFMRLSRITCLQISSQKPGSSE